jgi:hypothetical protein
MRRKHVDWEIYSSMYDGTINKKSGLLVLTLPSTGIGNFTTSHDREKEIIHPEVSNWMSIDTRIEYENRYPYLPPRIIDNLLTHKAYISVLPWSKVSADPAKLAFLINETSKDRVRAVYDLSRPMKRHNS